MQARLHLFYSVISDSSHSAFGLQWPLNAKRSEDPLLPFETVMVRPIWLITSREIRLLLPHDRWHVACAVPPRKVEGRETAMFRTRAPFEPQQVQRSATV